MKKIFKLSLVLFAGLSFVFASCSKVEQDIVTEEPVETPGEEVVTPSGPVSMTVSIPEEGIITKVSFTPDVDGSSKPIVKLAWENTDVITVNGEDFVIVPASISVDGKTATFTGDDPGASPYTIAYNSISGPIGAQIQASDNNTEHLGYSAALTGVDAYKDVQFSSAWASTHGGTFAQSGVLHLQAKLPSTAIAGAVQKVIIRTPGNSVLNGSEELSVIISTPGDADSDQILNVYAVLNAASTIPVDAELFVDFQVGANAYQKYTAYRKFASAKNIEMGKLNEFKLNCVNIDKSAGTSDAGTSVNPYLIADQNQMVAVDGLMAAGETKYFKLLEDIDMTGATWTMLNNPDPFDRMIDFDGNSKTISNLGGTMFYVFKGAVKNLTLDTPTVTNGNKKGTFAQFIQGTNNTITNLDVCNVSTFAGSSGPCGGLVGLINNGEAGETTVTFKDCDLTDVVVNSGGGTAGGFVGTVEAKVVFKNCTRTGGTVTNTADYAGGFIGKATAEVNLTDCSVSKNGATGSVSGVAYSAGFIGYYSSGTITTCHTDADVTGTGHYAGGLIAYMVNGSISQSYATGDVEISASKKYREGGLIGWAEQGSVSQCYATGNVTGNQYVGGLIGTVSVTSPNTFTISESCYTTGTVDSGGNYISGIVASKEGTGSLSITNCYASGKVECSGPQRMGGILAGHLGGETTIENCYFSGTLKTNACIGGIVGWVDVNGLSVTRCMSYPTELKATQTVATTDRYCSGIVIGYANKSKSPTMIVDHCYRPSGVNFLDYTGVAAINVAEDHDFITGTPAAIPQRHDLSYGYYHHGQETDSANLSALVQRDDIGGAWSSSIWNFDEAYPRLTWMLPPTP